MKTRLLSLWYWVVRRLPEVLLALFVLALAPAIVLAALALRAQAAAMLPSPARYWRDAAQNPWPAAAALTCVLGAGLLIFLLWRNWQLVWAVARKMIIEGLHRKVVLVLLIFFIVLMFSMPFILKTEGSLKSQVQLVLLYSLVLAMVLLSLVAIFLSAASVCSEIEHKQVHITDTKPLPRWQFLFGKWLGVVILCTTALFAMSVAVFLFVMYLVRPPDTSHMDRKEAAKVTQDYESLFGEVLVGRKVVPAVLPPDLDATVDKQMKELQAKDQLPHGRTQLRRFRESLTDAEMGSRMTLASGDLYVWRFNGLQQRQGPLYLRFYIYADTRVGGMGRWLGMRRREVKDTQGKSQIELVPVGEVPPPPSGWLFGSQNIVVPAAWVEPGGTLFLAYQNLDERTVSFAWKQNYTQVMQEEASFLVNYYRTVLVLICHIALLAALGVMAGSLFSFPVASLTVVFFFIVGLIGPWFASFMEPPAAVELTPMQDLLLAAWQSTMGTVLAVMPHFGKYNPLGDLTDGRLITWAFVASAAAVMLFIKGGAALLIGMYIYARRELARIIV
jgi:hypothetical protein